MSIPNLAVFDLGGVVVRICRTWQEACNAAGITHIPQAEARLDSPRKVGFCARISAAKLSQRITLPGLRSCWPTTPLLRCVPFTPLGYWAIILG